VNVKSSLYLYLSPNGGKKSRLDFERIFVDLNIWQLDFHDRDHVLRQASLITLNFYAMALAEICLISQIVRPDSSIAQVLHASGIILQGNDILGICSEW